MWPSAVQSSPRVLFESFSQLGVAAILKLWWFQAPGHVFRLLNKVGPMVGGLSTSSLYSWYIDQTDDHYSPEDLRLIHWYPYNFAILRDLDTSLKYSTVWALDHIHSSTKHIPVSKSFGNTFVHSVVLDFPSTGPEGSTNSTWMMVRWFQKNKLDSQGIGQALVSYEYGTCLYWQIEHKTRTMQTPVFLGGRNGWAVCEMFLLNTFVAFNIKHCSNLCNISIQIW